MTGDGVEILVELRDDGTLGVGFETVDADFFDVHDVLFMLSSSLLFVLLLDAERKRSARAFCLALSGGKNVTEHYFCII